MSYSFSTDWHSMWTGEWKEDLADLVGKPINVLEVGSFEGRSACWLLDNILTNPNSRITCVDTFERSDYEVFRANINDSGHAEKVLVMIGRSEDALINIRYITTEFDLIYVDGSHDSRDVIKDLILSFDLLKKGGIMIMDDYEIVDPLPSPKEAIDAFLSIYRDDIEIIRKGYQVTIRRK